MPKVTEYPRLRTLTRKMRSGRVHTYYAYDMRGTGKPDVQLGKDWDKALARWREIHHNKPQIRGTLEEVFQQWERDVLPHYSSAETRRGYTKGLRFLRKAFCREGELARWEDVKLPHLKGYLRARKGKTQANREMSLLQVVWNYARTEGFTEVPWPAAGMGAWKNKEQARKAPVSDEMFEYVYRQGNQLLRDAMDLASATSMRVTDVRTVPLPPGDILRLSASKTGKEADFDISLSAVLPDLIRRRRANKKAEHLMLLAGPFRRPVTYNRLWQRFVDARTAAAVYAYEEGNAVLGAAIENMILRDCRKYAADKAPSLEAASELLQHSDINTTRRHYRSKVEILKPAR